MDFYPAKPAKKKKKNYTRQRDETGSHVISVKISMHYLHVKLLES